MFAGAITSSLDVAQVVLYVFWVFFAGLIFYLHRESKREGYPLESDRLGGTVAAEGFPKAPPPKTYLLRDGSSRTVPTAGDGGYGTRAVATSRYPGAPIEPVGDPMLAAVGPGSYAPRPDVPDRTVDGRPRIVPLRGAADFSVAGGDPDPRGMPVVGADYVKGGVVCDLWVDQAEILFRYLEVDTGSGRVLLPVNFSSVEARRVKVEAILGGQFAGVPRTRSADQVTMLEEERITAYYGAGTLYARPERAEPLL